MPRRYLYVPITEEYFRRLVALAERERREVKQQAAYMLERALDKEMPELPPEEPTDKPRFREHWWLTGS